VGHPPHSGVRTRPTDDPPTRPRGINDRDDAHGRAKTSVGRSGIPTLAFQAAAWSGLLLNWVGVVNQSRAPFHQVNPMRPRFLSARLGNHEVEGKRATRDGGQGLVEGPEVALSPVDTFPRRGVWSAFG
jgi:hypothetical protein